MTGPMVIRILKFVMRPEQVQPFLQYIHFISYNTELVAQDPSAMRYQTTFYSSIYQYQKLFEYCLDAGIGVEVRAVTDAETIKLIHAILSENVNGLQRVPSEDHARVLSDAIEDVFSMLEEVKK